MSGRANQCSAVSQLDRPDGRTGRGVFVVFIIRYLIIYTTYLYLCLCLPAGYIYIYIYILHLPPVTS